MFLEEFAGKVCNSSAKFWEKGKRRENKALKSLKNKTRKLEWEEKSMTKNARDHFELVGRGLVQEANEEGEGAERMSQGQETGQEGGFKEPFKDIQGPTGYEEVKKAMEAMKWGKGVGVDKWASRCSRVEEKFCGAGYIRY